MDYVATAIVVTLVILLGVGIVVNELLRLKQWLKNSRPDAETGGTSRRQLAAQAAQGRDGVGHGVARIAVGDA